MAAVSPHAAATIPPAIEEEDKQSPSRPMLHQTSSATTDDSINSSDSLSARRPRWLLHIQAQIWRFLMGIGMVLHRLAPPRPPSPTFTRSVQTTLSCKSGKFSIQFYVPRDYEAQKRLRAKKYPVVVNFHGGGFTLGTATDDARWAKTVVDEVGAVVASVEYRLAPEHAFPTAVEDGADAILYLAEHADELNLDTDKIAISGFSAGANMCFTVPLRLQSEIIREDPDEAVFPPPAPSHRRSTSIGQRRTRSLSLSLSRRSPPPPAPRPASTFSAATFSVPPPQHRPTLPLLTDDEEAQLVPEKSFSQGRTLAHLGRKIKIKALCSFYPPTDYTQTREQRRMTLLRADQDLPAIFTALFDESYLQPPTLDMKNPYLSPGVAPRSMLAGLPHTIILFTCEWDMLMAEGERFRDRLRNECHKDVVYTCVKGVPHGWDKAPNPLKTTPGVKEHYLKACRELKRAFKE